MIGKLDALLSLCPAAEWILRGDNIEWLSKDIEQPTDAEINAEVQRLLALEPKLKRIAELKQMLLETDYVVLADYDQDKPEIKAQRKVWRDEIRNLQSN